MPYNYFSRSSVLFQGQRGGAKKLSILTQIECCWPVTPVGTHWWLWNDAQSLKYHRRGALLFLAATKQLYEWFSPSVCTVCTVSTSVCLLVCLSHLFDYVPIIMKFSGVITNDKSDVHAKGQGQRSRSQGYKNGRIWPRLGVSGL